MKSTLQHLLERYPALPNVATLAALLLVAFIVTQPLAVRVRRAARERGELRANLAQAQTLQGRLADEERAVQRVAVPFNELEQQLASAEGVAHILEQLRHDADELRLDCRISQSWAEQFDASEVNLVPGLALREMPLTMTLTGGYRQLGQFLAKLDQAQSLIDVRGMTMSVSPTRRPQLEATVNLAIYLKKSPG